MNTTEPNKHFAENYRTKLKFLPSEKTSALISFVTIGTFFKGAYGVRADSPYEKKIVIASSDIQSQILPNVLYECDIIPMKSVDHPKTGEKYTPGYIAINATPVQFKATVTTNYSKARDYSVAVKFGNKTIRFDPYKGTKESVKSFPACMAVLSKRCDIKDINQVIADFEKAAVNILDLLRYDKQSLGRNWPARKRNSD